MAETKYQAILAVIAEGRTVAEVASQSKVDRRTVHRWLARYEAEGLEGLAERSHRPVSCPHQMPAEVEAMVLESRRTHRYWGARRLALELVRKGVAPAPSESAVYRCLVRAAAIDPMKRHRRQDTWKRWERSEPMELWQMDTVGGFLMADGTAAKALTGLDDHSRYCVSAKLMPRERTQLVCDGFSAALKEYGVPAQVLTDNGKVFTGRFGHPPVEVLFDRICRLNGVEHLLTQPRTPTTTGKIERFHRTLRIEFDTRQVFTNLRTAQQALDEWVEFYNTGRTHQSLGDATPASRFRPAARTLLPERNGEQWVSRLSCCFVEFRSMAAAKFDVARFGSEVIRPSPRQADVMIVSGTLTKKMAPSVVRLYWQMAEPKYLLAMGNCTVSGGIFTGGYSQVDGIDQILPVDMYLPGCPPRPEALIHGMMELQRRIRREESLVRRVRIGPAISPGTKAVHPWAAPEQVLRHLYRRFY